MNTVVRKRDVAGSKARQPEPQVFLRCGCNKGFRKYGRDRKGRPRFECKACGKVTIQRPEIEQGKLPAEKERLIEEGFNAGWSVRKIATYAGVATQTVSARRPQHAPVYDLHEPVTSPGGCDYCGKRINRPKECERRTARTKHKFCNQDCYQKFFLVADEKRLAAYLKRVSVKAARANVGSAAG